MLSLGVQTNRMMTGPLRTLTHGLTNKLQVNMSGMEMGMYEIAQQALDDARTMLELLQDELDRQREFHYDKVVSIRLDS